MSKRKPVNVEIIKRTAETEAADGVYGVMDSIIASCRPDLADVAIGLAWRYGFEWRLGNFADAERIEASDWYEGKALCLQNLRSSVAISMQDIQITGKADARRATAARRDSLLEQFEGWLKPLIDAAEEAEKGTEDTESTEGQE